MEKRPSLVKLIIGLILLLGLALGGLWWLQLHNFSLRFALDDGLNVLRNAGPLAFFTAMAIL
ncbi:MAG: hypothetical protein WCJ10_04170, partial [Opitutaceae bacterium]